MFVVTTRISVLLAISTHASSVSFNTYKPPSADAIIPAVAYVAIGSSNRKLFISVVDENKRAVFASSFIDPTIVLLSVNMLENSNSADQYENPYTN